MKVLSATQIQQWDAYTIKHEPISSIDLMERAALQCTQWVTEHFSLEKTIKIFCGKGNNGGDGLAISRQLIAKGYDPVVYIIEFGAKGSPDFQINLERLHIVTTNIHFIQSPDFFPIIEKEDIIIDALFGSGLNRPLDNLYGKLATHLNQSAAVIISIDVPSGMATDKSSKGNIVIKANHTLTFQSLKLCFLMPENAEHFGNVNVLNIGLHVSFVQDIETDYQLIYKKDIAAIIHPRKKFSHKGNYGHALLIAGSTGKMGAAVLAAKATLRSGVGLVTVNVPEEERNILQSSVPEAMLSFRKTTEDLNKYATIGIGPAIGINETSSQLLHDILTSFKKPMLLDADALTILSSNKDWLTLIPENSVITPHPKEFDRLFGNSENDFDRIDKAITLSEKYPWVIVLKNHYSLIAYKGKGWFNTTGNAGLAKGGSGDILSGIITALLSQGYASVDAVRIGVYLHGLSADIALQHQSMESMIASDVIECIGKAFSAITNNISS